MRWVMMCLIGGSLMAGDWSHGDTVREGVFLGTLLVDWAQTRQIQAHPDRWHEVNPLIGGQPGQVNRYFIAGALVHMGVAYLLPPKARKVFQYVTIGMEGGCIAQNYSIGVRFSF